MQCLRSIRYRCTNPKATHYNRYGGRGISFDLTFDQLVFVWQRDNGAELNSPSIERADNDGNYTLSNIKFIELLDNIKSRPNHWERNREEKSKKLSRKIKAIRKVKKWGPNNLIWRPRAKN